MLGNDMTALVMSGGKYLCTYSSPAPPTLPPAPLHPLCRRCIKKQRDTGNTSSRNVLSHLLSHETVRLLLFVHREICLLIKSAVIEAELLVSSDQMQL